MFTFESRNGINNDTSVFESSTVTNNDTCVCESTTLTQVGNKKRHQHFWLVEPDQLHSSRTIGAQSHPLNG
uniref:Uncharacterized protein n=1 Tax=Arion vulgaris TaxID=1028688 RepID=A0A0B7BGC9_9EUPU